MDKLRLCVTDQLPLPLVTILPSVRSVNVDLGEG